LDRNFDFANLSTNDSIVFLVDNDNDLNSNQICYFVADNIPVVLGLVLLFVF